MWNMPDLASVLSIAAGVIVVTVALVGFLGWRLSRRFVYGDQRFTDQTDTSRIVNATIDGRCRAVPLSNSTVLRAAINPCR